MNCYGDKVEVKENLDEAECPFCGEPSGCVLVDYTGMHNREILIHCLNEQCDNLYIRIYKFSHVVKLNKEIDFKPQNDKNYKY